MLKRAVQTLKPKQSRYLLSLICIFAFAVAARSQTTLTSFEDPTNLQQDVFYQGTDQHLYFRYYNSAQGWQIQDLTSLTGAPLGAQHSAVSGFDDAIQNRQHVFFQAGNGDIYHLYSSSNPTAWGIEDLTSVAAGSSAVLGTPLVAYYNSTNDVQYVFYIASNQDVTALVWSGGWSAADTTALTGAVPAAPGSALTGFQDPFSEHVFYEGTDQHVHEIYASVNRLQIEQTDNTARAGAPLAMVGSALASSFDSANQQEDIYFEDTNQNLQHLHYTYNSYTDWISENLTAFGGIIPAQGSSISAFQDGVTGLRHVFYIGIDGHVHQYFKFDPWTPGDLTLEAGSLIGALPSPLASFKDDPDGQQHVFYLGADFHFYHLYYTNQWNLQDLTGGAPPPAF